MGYGNPYLQNCTNLWLSALDQGFTYTGPAWIHLVPAWTRVSLLRGLDKGFACTRHALWPMGALELPHGIPYGRL